MEDLLGSNFERNNVKGEKGIVYTASGIMSDIKTIPKRYDEMLQAQYGNELKKLQELVDATEFDYQAENVKHVFVEGLICGCKRAFLSRLYGEASWKYFGDTFKGLVK